MLNVFVLNNLYNLKYKIDSSCFHYYKLSPRIFISVSNTIRAEGRSNDNLNANLHIFGTEVSGSKPESRQIYWVSTIQNYISRP